MNAEAFTLPDQLQLGAVHLIVRDLARAVEWYTTNLGLVVHDRDAVHGISKLGDAQRPVIVLHEDTQSSAPGRSAGLFHYALLYPSRAALGRAAQRLLEHNTPLQGASDHGTHEAIYLADADGNGIELAADRPQGQWPLDLGYSRGPDRLEMASLLEAGGPASEHVDDGLRVGHLHLHVGDIDKALEFYRDLLGFELKAHLGTAAFVSAGGYHHHLGFNIWNGAGVHGPPIHSTGLYYWTIELPEAAVSELQSRLDEVGMILEKTEDGFALNDPWGTKLHVAVG